jgi:hypothetical protein
MASGIILFAMSTHDASHLDAQYFVDELRFNCPFCNRRHVSYRVTDVSSFNWANDKSCTAYFVTCDSCTKTSMHLSFIGGLAKWVNNQSLRFLDGSDLDSKFFYSVPTSFFVLDERIPRAVRELVTEAESCRKMNLLTGASACARKAIYELLVHESAEGEFYEEKIKSLKDKFTQVDPELFDVLAHIQNMTSDKVHEQSWPMWSSQNLTLILEALKAVLHEIYVVPSERSNRASKVRTLMEQVREKK